jgi:PAS domain S-box-containing protein
VVTEADAHHDLVPATDDSLAPAVVLGAMVEGTPELAFIVTDAAGNVLSWNEGAVNILGYSEAEMRGRDVAGLTAAGEPAEGSLSAALEEAVLTGTGVVQRWLRRRDGSVLWAHAVVRPVRDAGASLLGFGILLRDYSRTKEAEELLAQERRRREDLFLQAPAAIAIIRGPDHVFELANPLYERIIGRPSTELLGRPGREAIPELTEQGVWDIFDRIYATGEPFHGEEFPAKIERGHGDLEQGYFNFVGQPTYAMDGSVDGILIHAVDVTDLVQARLRVEQLASQIEIERERLAVSQQAGQIGTFEWDARTDHLLWTPELEALYGLAPGEFEGTYGGWLKRVHPDDRPTDRAPLDTVARGGSSIGEFRVPRPDGSVVWLASRGIMQYDEDGRPRRLIGVNVDITERKRIERNLQFLAEVGTVLSSSLEYERTLEAVCYLAVPAIADWATVHVLDDEGTLRQVALAHEDPVRVAAARAVQSPGINLAAEYGLARIMRTGETEIYPEITEAMLQGAARDEEHLVRLRSTGFTSAIMAPLKSNGTPIGVITLITAESRRTYTEADRALADGLAGRASLAIENARLYRDAQNAVALRDDFISIASHELKTPLTSLKIYAQVLHRQVEQRDIDKQIVVDRLGRMEVQIDRLTNLVSDLLDISRIQGGQLQYRMETFDLTVLIREIVEAPRPANDQHSITLSSPPHPVTVHADRERIGQVLVNLLSNALKYSPLRSEVMVTVDCVDATAHVAVRDTGYGIPLADQPHIFERFYRVTDTTRAGVPGLGMGLYLSREIAHRHRGDITVQSKEGVGSTFILTLPLDAAPRLTPSV